MIDNFGYITGGVIGAGSSLAGGIFGSKKAKKQANEMWQKNYEAQKEFAQNSIQWRKQDAIKAGINPYAVIGGQTQGFTPQDASYQNSYGEAIAQAGNRIGDMMGQLQMASAKEDLQGKKLDNTAKAIDVANKVLESKQMGQVSATIPTANPSLMAKVPKLEDFQKFKMALNSDGSARPYVDNASIDDFSALSAWFDNAHSPAAVEAFRDAFGGQIGYSPLGYKWYPEGYKFTDSDRAGLEAYANSNRYGRLSALNTRIVDGLGLGSILKLLDGPFFKTMRRKSNQKYGR